MNKRIQRIFENIEQKPDAIIIKNRSEPYIDENFFYVTGLNKGLFEGSIALIYPTGDIKLLVSHLESEIAKKTNAEIIVCKKKEEYEKNLKENLKNLNTVGMNYYKLIHTDYLYLSKILENKFIDVSKSFIKTRTIKDEDEINNIKQACRISDKVVEFIPDLLKDGITENDLAAEIDYLLMKNGAEKPAFDTISTFAENTALPHFTHSEKEIEKQGFVLCDFGACYNKYNSDITRTFVYGNITQKHKRMVEVVKEAQQVGFETAEVGVQANLVHKKVEEYINNTEFKDLFIHSTGHSLGLLVHDGGVGFTPDDETILEENMVLTIEPGVYLPGFGGVRIEDDVIIKKQGIEKLSKAKKIFI